MLAAAAGGRGPGLKKGAAGFVGVAPIIAATSADAGHGIANGDARARRPAKHPEGGVGVVLGGEDVDVQLRLGLLRRG